MKLPSFLLIMVLSGIGLLNEVNASETQEVSQLQQLELAYFYGVRHGKMDIVETFLQAGVDVNFQNNQGYTALMVAAFRGQVTMIDYLLEKQANACLVDHRGNTALMAAIVSAELSIAKKLLTQSCDDKNISHRTQEFALRFGQKDILALLKYSAESAEQP